MLAPYDTFLSIRLSIIPTPCPMSMPPAAMPAPAFRDGGKLRKLDMKPPPSSGGVPPAPPAAAVGDDLLELIFPDGFFTAAGCLALEPLLPVEPTDVGVCCNALFIALTAVVVSFTSSLRALIFCLASSSALFNCEMTLLSTLRSPLATSPMPPPNRLPKTLAIRHRP